MNYPRPAQRGVVVRLQWRPRDEIGCAGIGPARGPSAPMPELRTFVINLERSPDRLERITQRLQQVGLPFTRVSGVDGRQLDERERGEAIDEATFRRLHGMPSLPGEVGCYLSHVKAIRAFLATDADAALILEDDVQPDPALPQVLQALLGCPAHWDTVKISGVHSGNPVRVRQLTDRHWLTVMLTRCTGASAYVINRRAAQAYADGMLPMTLPYDHVYDQGWHFGLKVRLVQPLAALHDSVVQTTITPVGAVSRKFHWTRRLYAFWFRAGNEWRRVRYALGQLWLERGAR
jgi:glycosyl transferase family 25